MDDGMIMEGLIEPPIIDDGPELIDDDWGIRSVDDVWDRLDGPRFP